MLQRALATLLCLLGIAAIGLGVASATVWRPADHLTASLRSADGIVVTDPGVLDLAASSVKVSARAVTGPVVLALGRSDDVMAWVGDDAATRVSGLASRTLLEGAEAHATASAQPTPTGTASAAATPTGTASAAATPTGTASAAATPTETASAAATPAESTTPSPGATPTGAGSAVADGSASASPRPDPTGSDLWIAETSGTPSATFAWTAVPGRWSMLAVATAGGPVTIELTWPQVVTTPWRTPGIAVGSLLLLVGAVWWVLLLLQRSRPDAVLGMVTTAVRWRTSLRGTRRAPSDDEDRELAPTGAASSLGPAGPGSETGEQTAVGLPAAVDAPPGSRRARRALEAARAAAEGREVDLGDDAETGSLAQVTAVASPTVVQRHGAETSDASDAAAEAVVGGEPGAVPQPQPQPQPQPSGTGAEQEPAPLTRRALREQRERAERERAGRPADGRDGEAPGTGPVAPALAPAPAPAEPAPAEPDVAVRAGSAPADTAEPGAADAAEPGPRLWRRASRQQESPEPSAIPDPGGPRETPAFPTTAAPSSAVPESAGTRTPNGFRGLFRRRPVDVAVEPVVPTEAVSEPEQVADPAPAAASASADAWRRAWGLPAGGTHWTPDGPPEGDPEPPAPTAPTEEPR